MIIWFVTWWWLIPFGLACFVLGIAFAIALGIIFAVEKNIEVGRREDD